MNLSAWFEYWQQLNENLFKSKTNKDIKEDTTMSNENTTVNTNNGLKLSQPWVEYWQQLNVMFGNDPEIQLEYHENESSVILRVDNPSKADALTQLLPPEVHFGNIVLNVIVIPSNEKKSLANLYNDAFHGNPHFAYVAESGPIMGFKMTYVVFKKEVAQYWNDNMGDIHGNTSTLYQNIADKLFNGEGTFRGVRFCTGEDDE